MKILSWNTRGLGDASKRLAIKRLLKTLNPDLVLIQETKQDAFYIDIIKTLQSLKNVGWTFVESIGRSSGILTVG